MLRAVFVDAVVQIADALDDRALDRRAVGDADEVAESGGAVLQIGRASCRERV